MASVAVVLINWRSSSFTLKCVNSLRRSDFADYRIYIVDNDSGDDSLSILSSLGSEVQIIANSVNAGWAGGGNVGVEAALADGCQYVFLLNNDAEVRPDTIGRLVEASEALGPDVVLGALVVDRPSGEVQFLGTVEDPASGTPKWLSERADLLERRYIESQTSHGAAIFAQGEHFRRVGLFDERFFLNFDDADWCARAKKHGLRCVVVTQAVVDHYTSASIGGVDSPLQLYFLYRNELLYARKHCSGRQRGVVAVRMARLFLRVIRREGRGKRLAFQQSRAAALGVLDYLLGRFGDCPTVIRQLQVQWRGERLT
jgi:GT2 family glycosyltransferase